MAKDMFAKPNPKTFFCFGVGKIQNAHWFLCHNVFCLRHYIFER